MTKQDAKFVAMVMGILIGIITAVAISSHNATRDAMNTESVKQMETLKAGAAEACNAITIRDVTYNIYPINLDATEFRYLVETETGDKQVEVATSSEIQFSWSYEPGKATLDIRYDYNLNDALQCVETEVWRVYRVDPKLIK